MLPARRDDSPATVCSLLPLVALALVWLAVHAPPTAADPAPAIVAAEAWLEAMRVRFDENPELRNQPGSGWKPYNRVKWLVDQRRAGGEMPDPMSRWRAWEARRARELDAAAAAATSWFQLGPTTLSGRMLDIEFHPSDPSIVYAGSAGGGLWKSTDGGDSWTALTDDLPDLAIGGIAVLPADPDVVLIGTGEATFAFPGLFGQGIFKSTDGGDTWNPTSLTFGPGSFSGFHVLEVNPLNGVILAGSNSGLYRSTDQGDNWTLVETGNWSDIKWKPGDFARVYGARLLSGINVSTDNGLTWNIAGTGQPDPFTVDKTKIGVLPADPAVIYAHYASRNTFGSLGVYRSTDNGDTWEVRNDTRNMLGAQGWYNLSLVVDPDDADRLISGGVRLYGSTDGGVSWTVLNPGNPLGDEGNTHLDNHAALYEPGSTTNVWVGTDGGLWRSTDDGASWQARIDGLVTYQFYDVCVAQSSPQFMMGGTQDNGVPGRVGPDTWFQSTLIADGMVCNITPTNQDEIYAEWQFGNHVKSTNGGHTWFPIQGGITGDGRWITPVDQDQNDPDHLFTSSNAGIFRTRNGGGWWDQMTGPEDQAIWLSMSPIDGNIVWSLEQMEVRYTTDDGETWAAAAPYGFTHNRVTRIYAHPADPGAAFVTFGGYTPLTHIGYTSDMGNSWVDVSGDLPVLPVNAIVVDPLDPSTWFIATDVGVWWSTDGGAHWLPFATGFPNAMVLDVEIQGSARKLVAGTHGRGAWEVDLPTQTSVAEASSPDATLRLMLDPPIANPVRTRTAFRFAARSETTVGLDIYDVVGRKVDRVASLPRGDGTVRVVHWDASRVPNGVYFAVLRSGSDRLARRLVVAR